MVEDVVDPVMTRLGALNLDNAMFDPMMLEASVNLPQKPRAIPLGPVCAPFYDPAGTWTVPIAGTSVHTTPSHLTDFVLTGSTTWDPAESSMRLSNLRLTQLVLQTPEAIEVDAQLALLPANLLVSPPESPLGAHSVEAVQQAPAI